MSSKVPVYSQISWPSFIVQMMIIFIFSLIFEKLSISEPILIASLLYIIVAFILRKTITKDHRNGMRILKQHQYFESIPYFEKSIVFFEQNAWIDTNRFITLFSYSKISYKEMALCNIAFAYSQIGEGENAIIYYEKVKAINPSNGLAIAGLNMLNSIKQK